MERIKEEIRRILLFAPVPNQEDLQCILGNILQVNLSNSLNSYKLKILKCRMLIFSEPRVIASPVHGMDCQVYIIMSKDFYKSGKIQQHLEKIGIRAGRNARVTNSIYEACLRYTILARIAPLWNQVGSYLVNGRDFLSLREPLHAITFDVIMTGKELSMIIWPYRLMMYNVTLEELMDRNNENLGLHSEVEIDEGKWVYVLPSLNKAQVVSVSKKFPKSSTFSSYKQLKRHWKNSYGYRIPEEEDCSFYVTVTFGRVRPKLGPDGWSGTAYAYPGMCVCQCPPVILRCRDQTVPLQSFLNELSVRVPQICDHSFAGDQVELGYAIPKLYSCSSENHLSSEQKFNLKDFMASYKSLDGICQVPVENPTFLVQSTYPSAELLSTKASATSVFEGNPKHFSPNQVKSKEEDRLSNNGGNDYKVATATPGKLDVKEKIRYVPIFKNKSKQINSRCKLPHEYPGRTTNSVTQKMLVNSKENLNRGKNKTKNEVHDRQENTTKKPDKILKLKVLKQEVVGNGLKTQFIGAVQDRSQYVPKGSPNILPKIIGPDSILYNNCTADKMSTNNKNASPIKVKGQEASKRTELGSTTILRNDSPDLKAQDKISSFDQKKCAPVTHDKGHYFTMEFGLWDGGRSEISTSQQNTSLMNWKDMFSHSSMLSSGSNQHYQGSVIDGVFPIDKNELSSHEVNEEEKLERSLMKKNTTSRGRPAVQVGIDVEALAKEGMLSRANTTTLISWLRSRGVACRVKDKKSDLVHSVETFLGLHQINHPVVPQNVQELNLSII